MEALTRLVTDSLARHGFDRPIDPRRLQWSRWFPCDSPHSLLVVPSKPGIFALAEEIMDLGPSNALGTSNALVASNASGPSKIHVGTAALACPDRSLGSAPLGGAALQRCDSPPLKDAALAAEVPQRRMLAVLQFSEDDDMAFTLDRMFTQVNPMRARFATGRCFLRFVVIEDQAQRRSICSALNQWMLSSAEKASGLPADFPSSLEFTDCVGTARVGRTLPSTSSGQALSDNAGSIPESGWAPPHDSGANKNLHCPHPLPSGF
jgi:hypothetical protein